MLRAQHFRKFGRKDAVADIGHRAGHHDMAAVRIPVDPDRAAIHDDAVGSRPEPAPDNSRADGAGTASAGHGDADTTLPDAHSEGGVTDAADNRQVYPLREQRRMFGKRSEPRQIDRLGIVDEDDGMRIANRMAHGVAEAVNSQRHGKRVNLMRQRQVTPARRDRSHIDGNLATFGAPCPQPAGVRLDADLVAAVGVHDKIGDTTRAVATGAGRRAVMVQDVHADIGAVGRAYHQNLVAADAKPPVGKPRGDRRADGGRAAGAPVENDEIISKTVHFQKFRHGQRIRQIPANEKRRTARA